ncbi:MAG: protein phosphatase CheZ [Bdellovibrionales bacterium]
MTAADDVLNKLKATQKMQDELQALAEYIKRAKSEISAIQSSELNTKQISSATDELDAVITDTEDATNKIMNACDKISEICQTLSPETKGQLLAAVTSIYEACNFQDITGQRITKVVRALRHIEEWVQRLVAAVGGNSGVSEKAPQSGKPSDAEQGLLNGPQLPGKAIGQDEIDKLMASFDAPPSSN